MLKCVQMCPYIFQCWNWQINRNLFYLVYFEFVGCFWNEKSCFYDKHKEPKKKQPAHKRIMIESRTLALNLHNAVNGWGRWMRMCTKVCARPFERVFCHLPGLFYFLCVRWIFSLFCFYYILFTEYLTHFEFCFV